MSREAEVHRWASRVRQARIAEINAEGAESRAPEKALRAQGEMRLNQCWIGREREKRGEV